MNILKIFSILIVVGSTVLADEFTVNVDIQGRRVSLQCHKPCTINEVLDKVEPLLESIDREKIKYAVFPVIAMKDRNHEVVDGNLYLCVISKWWHAHSVERSCTIRFLMEVDNKSKPKQERWLFDRDSFKVSDK